MQRNKEKTSSKKNQSTSSDKAEQKKSRHLNDLVDEAGEESFPASDAPASFISNTSGVGRDSKKSKKK